MPQLDLHTFPPQLIWLAITFIVLYILMTTLGLPRVQQILATRRDRVEGDLERASQMKTEAEAVIAAYERALADARAQAQATMRDTRDKLNAEAAAAVRRIAEAKSAALANLREVAVEVARAAATRLAGIEVDATRAGAAVDRVMRERA